MLVTSERIQAAADRIAAEFHPDEIILYGSYAYGTPNDDSDVDLLVIMPTDGRVPDTIGAVCRVVRDGFAADEDGFPLDVVIYDPDAVQQRFLLGDWFMRDVVGKGKSLFRGSRETSSAVRDTVRAALGLV